jgi:hypothetical protein
MAGNDTTIVAEVLVPEAEFVAEYTTNNPAKILGVMLLMMKENWRVSSANVYTDKIKWDVTGEKVDLYGEFRCRDKRDRMTYVMTRIIVMGTQDPKTKDGTIQVKVKPKMYTTIQSKTPIDKALKEMYLRTFYREQYKTYMAIAKKRVTEFDDRVRIFLGIEEREAGSLPGSKL